MYSSFRWLSFEHLLVRFFLAILRSLLATLLGRLRLLLRILLAIVVVGCCASLALRRPSISQELERENGSSSLLTFAFGAVSVLSPLPPASRAFLIFAFSLSIMFWTDFLLRPSGSWIESHGIPPAFSMVWKRIES